LNQLLIGYYHRQIAERTEDRRKKKEESMFGIFNPLTSTFQLFQAVYQEGPEDKHPQPLSYEKIKHKTERKCNQLGCIAYY
jgi:hypothetical protein